jgi:hypothetical protein
MTLFLAASKIDYLAASLLSYSLSAFALFALTVLLEASSEHDAKSEFDSSVKPSIFLIPLASHKQVQAY